MTGAAPGWTGIGSNSWDLAKTGREMAPHRRQEKKVSCGEEEEASGFTETSLPPPQAEAKKHLLGPLWKGHGHPSGYSQPRKGRGHSKFRMSLICHTGVELG